MLLRHCLLVTVAVSCLTLVSSQSKAASITMLPPAEGSTANTCAATAGTNKVLTWDGINTISCQTNLVTDASGNLGIGTASPGGRLDVHNQSGAAFVRFAGRSTMAGAEDHVVDFIVGQNIVSRKAWGMGIRGPNDSLNPNGLVFSHFANTLGNGNLAQGANWYPTTVSISQLGNVGIGANASPFRLNVGTETNTTTTYPAFGVSDAGDIVVTGGADRLWAIYDDGLNTILGWNDSLMHIGLGGSPDAAFTVRVNGSFYADSGGIGAASDERLKKDIAPIKEPLEKVLALKGVTYKWRTDEFPKRKFEKTEQVGVIAQDVEKVLPQAVMTDGDGFKVVDYGRLSALLIEAMKEMKTSHDQEIQSLHKEIEGLKEQINAH